MKTALFYLGSLGQRPQPRVILILSNGLDSNSHQENWLKSMCTSFGEESTFPLNIVGLYSCHGHGSCKVLMYESILGQVNDIILT